MSLTGVVTLCFQPLSIILARITCIPGLKTGTPSECEDEDGFRYPLLLGGHPRIMFTFGFVGMLMEGDNVTMFGLMIMFAMCGSDVPKDTKEKKIMIERKHLKIVLLGETAVMGCQGGTGRQDGIWNVTVASLERWSINRDNALVIKQVALGESGVYDCTSRRSYHLTLLYVVYAPSGLFLVDPLPYKLQERCSPNLMSELNTFLGVALCTKSALDKNGECLIQVTGECMPLEPARDGYHWRYLLYILRRVPRLSSMHLHRLLAACSDTECVGALEKGMIRRPNSLGRLLKASRPIALTMEQQWRQEHDYLGLFVRDGAWLDRRVKARCPAPGSFLHGTMCVPCPPNTHLPPVDEFALASTECDACPKNYEQRYYGATDCTNKPKLVFKLASHGVFTESEMRDDGFGNIATMNVSTALRLMKKKFYSLSLPALVTTMLAGVFFLVLSLAMCVVVCRQGVGEDEKKGKKGGDLFTLRLPSLPNTPLGSTQSLTTPRKKKKKKKKRKKRTRSADSSLERASLLQ